MAKGTALCRGRMRCRYVENAALWLSLKSSCLRGQNRQGGVKALPGEPSPVSKRAGEPDAGGTNLTACPWPSGEDWHVGSHPPQPPAREGAHTKGNTQTMTG